MKKSNVILIAILCIGIFSWLVYYGFRHSRGVPVPIEEIKKETLEVPMRHKEIDLEKGIDLEFWDTLPGKEIKLLYQVMVLPWPKIVVPKVWIKAFHNAEDIYFYLEWPDESEDKILDINKFSDACAVLFSLEKKTETPSLMMGFLGKANIWHWKASQDNEYWLKQGSQNSKTYADFYYPFEEKELLVVSKEILNSAVSDLISVRVGTVTVKQIQNVQARGFYNAGRWRVVFKRALKVVDPEYDTEFGRGKRLSAFAVWEGSKGDRGGRKSISDWVELVVH
jgi:DMSO reductase family type II enzyme heme b subunit